MTTVETTNMISDVGLNTTQVLIDIRISRHKLGVILMLESKIKLETSCSEMIQPEFGEYKVYYEVGIKPELLLYWVRHAVAIFKKKTKLLIESQLANRNESSRINVVIEGNHGQGAFRFQMKR